MKKSANRGSITIEASLVLTIFIIFFVILHSISLSIMFESVTRKALFETGISISTYSQMIDILDNSKKIKTEKIDTKKYIDLLKEGFDDSNLIDLIKLAKDDGINLSKNAIIKNMISKIFRNRLNNYIKIKNFEKFGIKDGLQGFNFKNISILESDNIIELELEYSFNLDKYNFFNHSNKVNQKILINAWTDNQAENNKSIWNKSNFVRGRYFADLLRNKGIGIKPGYGVDIFNNDTNTLIQVFSLNIFNKSYSTKTGEKYRIKEEFLNQIKIYYKELKKNVSRLKNPLKTLDGNNINIKNPNSKLLIILPLETEEYTDIKNIISEINKIGNIEILYLEKALE